MSGPPPRLETSSLTSPDRATRIRRVLVGLLFANLAVVTTKLIVGIASHSLAVFGDALHSSVDALNNIVALVVIRVAAQAPDEDHPYGHSKFETLGALAIVGFLSITCFELVRGAIRVSLGWSTTAADVQRFLAAWRKLATALSKERGIAA